MAINKIALDGTTLIDLSTDTVASSDDIVSGKVGHLNDGSVVTGTASSGGGTDGVFFPINMTESVTPTITMKTVNEATMIDISGTNYISSGNFIASSGQTISLYYCDFGKTLISAVIVATKTASSNRYRFAFFNEDPSTFTTNKSGIGYYSDESGTTAAGTKQFLQLRSPYAARYMVVMVSNENTTTPAPTVIWSEI